MPDYGTNSQPGDPGHAAIHRAVGARLDELSDANLQSTIVSVGSGAFGRVTYVRDIREFLVGSEVLDRTGATNMSPIIQRAHDQLTTLYASTSARYMIRFPVGTYLCTDEITIKPGVGIQGEDRWATIFKTGANNCLFGDNDPDPWAGVYTPDIVHRNFTIDARAQTKTSSGLPVYDAALKFYICQHFDNMLIEDVTGIGSWASGFGFDFCTGKMRNCVSIGAGRGHLETSTIGKVTAVSGSTITLSRTTGISGGTEIDVFIAAAEPAWKLRATKITVSSVSGNVLTLPAPVGAVIGDRVMLYGPSGQPGGQGSGSGFGIGVGAREYEPFILENCASYHSGTNGAFTEILDNRAEGIYHPHGFQIIGGEYIGNKHGFLDAGSRGAVLTGAMFAMNRYAGLAIRPTFQTTPGGYDGQVTGCTFYRNGNELAPAEATNKGGGVITSNAGYGGYKFNGCTFRENYGPGFWATSGGTLGPDFGFYNCVFDGNQHSGILVSQTAQVKRLTIRGNTFRDNGANSSVTYRDGITLLCSTDALDVSGNVFADTRGTKLMQYGLRAVASARTMNTPRIMGNDYRGTLNGAQLIEHSIVDSRLVKDNAALSSTGFFEQDFTTTADGAWVTTQVGERAVITEASPSATTSAAVASGSFGQTCTTASSRRIDVVDVASATYVVKAIVSSVGTTRALSLVLRGASYNNYIGISGRIDGSNLRWNITQRIGGTATSVQDLGVTSADGDVLEVTCASGGAYTIKINGTTIGTYTFADASYASATRVGFHASQNPLTTGRWSYLKVSEIPA